ncbi:type I restriction-modification system subunit M [Sulfitobacter guttiformis]|uniref:site-specific DNA-methyltransferase (adenine-specific) n=1 Tax=Sulfitobacter guttiformis TaxID=74349 RepID=A0A420DTZ9_9RHOB|nr:class I SAM-dependent DNA methyltransferase [Sulfitobacter guttiformis]KIN71142.1 Type I restriction-modification system, M subunit [Sulfitobacter guttiformis KCTC 32187]RKE97619.1 type I restriction enzyme M protein [Sulfitobacter guttiformis]
MLTGTIRSQVDQIWNAFWSGGVSNPLSVIEQLTFLMFIKRLDDLHTLAERKAEDLGTPMERRIFPEGKDDKGEAYSNMRWSQFKHFEAREMMRIVDEHVFPFLRQLGEEGSSYGTHMKDARLGFSNPNLLAKVVQMLDDIAMDDRDTKGDVYEYMLGKIASAGANGQFRTPRHIIQLMVHIMAPTPTDTICDPAAGTSGFLVQAGEYLRQNHPQMLRNAEQRDHFHNHMFHGFDFDSTMLRIGAMNMTLHGIENPDISYRDSLAEEHGADAGAYSLILANPPFAGSLDYDTTAKDLLKIVKTKKTELLFMGLFLRLLRTGGRAAVVVPDGVLFGSSRAHKDIRKMLVEDHKLDAIIKLPSGVFRPYAGVSCAIVLFTKTGVGGTGDVWFYDMTADGYSLDDKRTALLDEDRIGATPAATLSAEEHAKNNLPDILARWGALAQEGARPRTAQSFTVPAAEIIATGSWDLSLNRYKEIEHADVTHAAPADIIAELRALEAEIAEGLEKLEGML